MSEPELEFEIDEFGCIRCRVANEGVFLSKDEEEFIIDHVMRMRAENAKLRELLRIVVNKYCESGTCDGCPILGKDESCPY